METTISYLPSFSLFLLLYKNPSIPVQDSPKTKTKTKMPLNPTGMKPLFCIPLTSSSRSLVHKENVQETELLEGKRQVR